MCNGLGRSALLAPDIDAQSLHAELAALDLCTGPPIAKPTAAALVTLYVSNKDVALRQSQALHGHQRAGQAGNEMILCRGVDTIDVSRWKGADPIGQSYHTEAGLLADMRAALIGTSPAIGVRHLTRVLRGTAAYYELSDATSKSR